MKGLVVGGGSIGSRHLRNLKKLEVGTLGLVEPDADRRSSLAAEIAVTGFSSLQAGLDWNPDFAVVATPSHLHVEPALELVRRGVPVFVEKPLAHTADGIEQLARLVVEKKLTTLVGCNMRFHPGPGQVKELVEQGSLGKLLFGRIHCGSFLPDWRPQADYRTGYAARAESGGGCILDCIHEIDLARWYLGEVRSAFCCAGHLSSLEIETEDVAALIFRHASGAISEVHLDYVQRTYERGCQIAGELGSVSWDFSAKAVRWYDATSRKWTIYEQPETWEVNQMYVDEMQHFIACLREGRPTQLPIPEAVRVMQVVWAAKASAEKGRMIDVIGESKA